jgi:ABC-2 type transport system ATP-binding protein
VAANLVSPKEVQGLPPAGVVVQVEGLRKNYGPTKAVDGIGFEIREGEIFGIVGPNGAGKTTTVECMEGLRVPDQGAIRVLGLDPLRDREQLRHQIGIQLQEGRLPDRLKVWEAMDLFSSFRRSPTDWRRLLQELGLADKAHAYFETLSGGQKQRLFVALSLVGDPKVVFFDELSTGLDPQARRAIWELVRKVRDGGKTVVLVTHFMDEAEYLCDRVAILDYGRVIALDTPGNLVKSAFPSAMKVSFELDREADPALWARWGQAETEGKAVSIYGRTDGFIVDVVSFLVSEGLSFSRLMVDRLSLEDVFLHLTGRKVRD